MEAAERIDFDVELGQALIDELRRPFAADAIKFKIQTSPREKTTGGYTMGLAVCYIDARLAAERLNHVVGLAWSESYKPVDGGLECAIKIGSTIRSDVGWSPGRGSDIDLKALYSDAFKRAAVKYGVGVSLYALPRQYVNAGQLNQRGRNWYLRDETVGELRGNYEGWLEAEGQQAFGEPLDHGDHSDAQGDVETDPEPVDTPSGDQPGWPAALELERLRAKARFMGEALADKTDTDPTDLRDLVSAATDEAELTRLYRSFSADLKENGGDPAAVSENFDQAHAAALA